MVSPGSVRSDDLPARARIRERWSTGSVGGVAILSLLAVFFSLQRYFVQGLLAGSVK